MPLTVLYGFSNVLFLMVYYLFGYRKKVVLENLRRSFPDKSEAEIQKIARDFYRHFCDVIVEIVKMLTLSKASFRKRFTYDEAAKEIFGRFEQNQQSVVGVMGHCGNWEWAAMSHPVFYTQRLTGVYHPLSNPYFNRLMLNSRSRYGGKLSAMNQVYRDLLSLRKAGISTVVGLISDQTPPPENAYWMKFLNQETPVFNGPEKIARKLNYPVIYAPVKKISRGRYEMSAVLITEDPASLPEGRITELHVKELEKNILAQPHIWLWSHRRWKHRKPSAASV